MSLYELTSEAAAIREGERVASLVDRSFPTLVMQWESRLFDQPWLTTIALDYTISLPPLVTSQSKFNEVRIAAFVGGAPTKFLYFGTELNSSVPRIAPEMENAIGPVGVYQEFRLEEHSCPIPYLKLIQTTPRIYGNGAQDYYSPPIKVERYDGVAGPNQIADMFPTIVANLDGVPGSLLTDPSQGSWMGSRYVGVTAIAIKRQGKIVGLHKRLGRTDKDGIPPIVQKRDPKLDLRRGWVAVDFGAMSTVVAVRSERGSTEIIRIGATTPITLARDNESPTEIAFDHVGRAVKAWRDRVILPMTRWEDVVVGGAARAMRTSGDLRKAAASIPELSLLRERIERKETFKLRGFTDPDTTETLKKPAPPIIDEDGIGAHDPFDPIELYAYYIGLHVNQRTRGLYTHYAVTMPLGFSEARRESVLAAFRRGFFRSLPAGMINYDDLVGLEVVDGGAGAIAFLVQALRAFGVHPKGETVPIFVIDAGATETGLVGGVYRDARGDEKAEGVERIIEYVEPTAIDWFGGERILHRMAEKVYVANLEAMREERIAMEPSPYGEPIEGVDELFEPSPEARTNAWLLRDALRPLLETGSPAGLPSSVNLLSVDGRAVRVALSIDDVALAAFFRQLVSDAVVEIKNAIAALLAKVGREPDPYDGLHIFFGGRLGMNSELYEAVVAELPPNVKPHRFLEPDKTNLQAPTVRTATALGILSMRLEPLRVLKREEARDAFRYRVGRARHGELADVLEPSVDYDTWREMGACSKADIEVLFMLASDDGEVAADDPRVRRALCSLGESAIGQRVYLRATGPTKVEVSVGPPGGEPADGAPCWVVDLKSGGASKAK